MQPATDENGIKSTLSQKESAVAFIKGIAEKFKKPDLLRKLCETVEGMVKKATAGSDLRKALGLLQARVRRLLRNINLKKHWPPHIPTKAVPGT